MTTKNMVLYPVVKPSTEDLFVDTKYREVFVVRVTGSDIYSDVTSFPSGYLAPGVIEDYLQVCMPEGKTRCTTDELNIETMVIKEAIFESPKGVSVIKVDIGFIPEKGVDSQYTSAGTICSSNIGSVDMLRLEVTYHRSGKLEIKDLNNERMKLIGVRMHAEYQNQNRV